MMINPAQQLLLDVIRAHGAAICKDPEQLEVLLERRAGGQYSREIALWLLTLKSGIVSLIIKNRDKPLGVTAHHLAHKMHEDCGMELQAASWAIESWMIALGLLADGHTLPLHGTVQTNGSHAAKAKEASWASAIGQDEWGDYAETLIFDVVQRFRWIPPGTFLMGSPSTELHHYADEIQFEVTLTRGFWMADTVCTQTLWDVVVAKKPSAFRDNKNNPVERVSWDDVQEFLTALRALMPGMNARLPTEAQWEYACRAGTTTPFSFGQNISTDQVNYDGSKPYADAPRSLFRRRTVPVKTLPQNPWGLYEIHGNVWEWCQDIYGDYPREPTTNPVGAKSGSGRVIRGGSWARGARGARSANRSNEERGASSEQIGFRFVVI